MPEPVPQITIINARDILVIPLDQIPGAPSYGGGLKRSEHDVNLRTLKLNKKTNVVDIYTFPRAVLAQSSCMASMGK